ncbi:MAG: nucleotidyltransferase domain-containing protein [Chromatiaceae bacterium]|nr:nucleotidyltransferase domain-containing protein [Chromatiaceae bacterium]
MEDPMTFGLSERIRADIRQVFGHYPAIERVLIFGSRAKGNARPGSDIDLAVIAPEITDAEFARLWNAIDDLPLVFKVDLLHWDRLANPRLKDKIPREGCLFYARPTDRRAEVAA